MRTRYLLAMLLLVALPAQAQTFTDITDTIPTSALNNHFGVSWIDIDGDGDLDLYATNAARTFASDLLGNNGDGTFTHLTDNTLMQDVDPVAALGSCWGDYDNDGHLDVFVAAGPFSILYHNESGSGDPGTFARVTSGDIVGSVDENNASDQRGWSCAWGDYDNDSYIDLFVAHPAGFVWDGTNDCLNGLSDCSPIPNSLFRNNGDGTFARVTDTPISEGIAPFTVGQWTDYDEDGDVDLFVGSGPANGFPGPDFIYRNLMVENGSAGFELVTEGPFAEDLRDGQVWNFIDHDNDGDLDAYVTNYSNFANEFYLNDGGTYVRQPDSPLMADGESSLANVWGDFDNDGDLDVFVTNEAGAPNRYFRNTGPPTYAFEATDLLQDDRNSHYGASAGDFDNDGDLDLFVATGSLQPWILYRNDTAAGNHWLKLRLVGTASNRAALGAKVFVTATIDGAARQQRREVSSQNSFNGQNSLVVHVGLGDATVATEVVVEWPSGAVDTFTDLDADQFLELTEGGSVTGVASEHLPELPEGYRLESAYPNPFNPATTIGFTLPEAQSITLTVYDALGRTVRVLADGVFAAGAHTVAWDGRAAGGEGVPSGVYLYRLQADGGQLTRTLSLVK